MIILNVTCIILDYRLDNEQPYRIKETSARLYQTLGNNNKWCPMDIFIFEDSWVNFIFVVFVRACVRAYINACELQEKHTCYFIHWLYGKIKLCRFRKVTITICKVITSLPDPMLICRYNYVLSIICVINFLITFYIYVCVYIIYSLELIEKYFRIILYHLTKNRRKIINFIYYFFSTNFYGK